MSQYLGNQLISGISRNTVRNAHTLLDFKWSDHIINSMEWLRADTFSWQNGDVYQAVYNHLSSDLISATEHKNYLSSNIAAVGNLANNNGVLSGFRETTVYGVINPPQQSTTSFEMQFKINVGATVPTANSDVLNIAVDYKGVIIRVKDKHFKLLASSNGTSWNIANTEYTGYTILQNTNYWVKLSWDGTTYTFAYSTDGATFITLGTVSHSNPLVIESMHLGGTSRESVPFSGTIDLNESYIKIDGAIVWNGCNYITYYEAKDGHKLTLADQEQNVVNYFNKYGVAWYYILDTSNTRFKLPRSKHEHYGNRPVVGNGITVGLTDGTTNLGLGNLTSTSRVRPLSDMYGVSVGTVTSDGSVGINNASMGLTTDGTKSGIISTPVQDTDQYKYLYFYVGQYMQMAIEQTAGLNAELFNGKADIEKVAHVVVEFQEPTASNNYTWYRKYADGWVEQGGYLQAQTVSAGHTAQQTLTFPIEMQDINYIVLFGSVSNAYFQSATLKDRTTTGGTVEQMNRAGSGSGSIQFTWQVSGMAAE